VVFLYEAVKLMVIAVILIMQGNIPGLLTNILLSAPGALFPLMALFIWIDADRYKAYLPLFSAGKCISISLLTGWLIAVQQVTMIGKLFSVSVYAELVLLCGDLLTLGAVLLIIKEPEMEEK
jgi:hypothetical protein